LGFGFGFGFGFGESDSLASIKMAANMAAIFIFNH
jgi:hypothetical protein